MNTEEIFFRQVLSETMAIERRRHADMVRRGMALRIGKGLPVGRIPLGYRRTLRGIVQDAARAECIRRAFAGIADGSVSVVAAWRRAGFEGLRNRSGRPISLSAFGQLLANPFYSGFIRYRGQVYAGKHKPVVDEQTFRRAGQRLAGPVALEVASASR